MLKRNHSAQAYHSLHTPLCFSFLLSALILLIGFSTKARGQITVPLSQLNQKLTKNISGRVLTVKLIDERLYIGTDKGLWIISDNDSEAIEVKNVKERICGLSKFDVQVVTWTCKDIWTFQNLWIISKDGTAKKVSGIDGKPDSYDSYEVAGKFLFVRTDNNLWIVGKDGTAKKVKFEEEFTPTQTVVDSGKTVQHNNEQKFTSIQVVGNEVIARTQNALWLVNEDGNAKIFFNFKSFAELDFQTGEEGKLRGLVFAPVVSSIFQIDPEVGIKSKLVPSSGWGDFVTRILPLNWLPSERVLATASYSDKNGNNPYEHTFPSQFRFAEIDGDGIPPDEKFSAQGQFTYKINWGRNEVRYWVKDSLGNITKHQGIYYGVPSQYSIVVLPLVISSMFVLSCFALAPKVGFCHSAIMNPWLRKYFSLGSVPLLLSVFPSLRRHLLRRYSTSINKAKEFSEWNERFVCPDEEFYPETFGKRIESERRLSLTGQSGIGKTSYFKWLTANYSSQEKPTHPVNGFPVYISLTNYGGNSIEDLVYNQLFSYGKISDKELAPMFLEQGGLLIFLDGVNEVQSVADRQKLSAFVEKFWTSNYICLSSQQSYPEIENIPTVQLKPFSKEKVGEFIRQRVNNKEKAEQVVRKITDEDYQLYSIPRDLEFAIDILNNGAETLPKSRTELYKITFSTIFAKWKKSGNTEAEDNLCKYAYAMIVERESIFDSVDNPKFKEVTHELYEQKFLVKREKCYNFRHDLIRAFLASEYFYPRWQNLFAGLDGNTIDSNWLEMLKFSCESIKDSNEVKALVYAVLEKSLRKDLVKDLVKWLKTNQPSKCMSWENDFYAQYGSLDFK